MKNPLFETSFVTDLSQYREKSNTRKLKEILNSSLNLYRIFFENFQFEKRFYLLILLFLVQCTGTRPIALGVQNGKLGICPETPNCVGSFVAATDPEHFISPLSYTGTPDEAMIKLKTVIREYPRTQIIKEESNYLYVEFTSFFWRFVDDVEFLVDSKTSKIQVRSASRLGKSDLGVNRKRIESIRKEFDLK
ncbi:DUF1499 domain-containing protein [Leptospira sp. WS92.C1]